MNQQDDNNRETGARAPREAQQTTRPDQRAAANKPPEKGEGLSQPADETNERTRQSDGRDQDVSHNDTQKQSGAGPALAERSKDARR